jgi:hypothetical protein
MEFGGEGLTITLRRSKTEQAGQGTKIGIPRVVLEYMNNRPSSDPTATDDPPARVAQATGSLNIADSLKCRHRA